jgi:large subunit ribosomal protein L15
MMIHELTPLVPAFKRSKRLGRGKGSGRGKTSTRGQKGAGSRRGHHTRFAFEGGQMPFFRRMPKMGFTNADFRTEFWAVNLADVLKHPDFAKGGTITGESLIKAGLVRDASRPVKIMGDLRGQAAGVKVKLNVTVERVTGPARKHITDAGGSVNETGTRRDRVRGVDRNAEDRSPRNLTKKLKRGRKAGAAKPTIEAAE